MFALGQSRRFRPIRAMSACPDSDRLALLDRLGGARLTTARPAWLGGNRLDGKHRMLQPRLSIMLLGISAVLQFEGESDGLAEYRS
jgi:hypothetical protein